MQKMQMQQSQKQAPANRSQTKSIDETVDYVKVIDHLTDVIKELNYGAAAAPVPAERSPEDRHSDAVDLLKALLSTLEQGTSAAGAADAEHGAVAQQRRLRKQQQQAQYW